VPSTELFLFFIVKPHDAIFFFTILNMLAKYCVCTVFQCELKKISAALSLARAAFITLIDADWSYSSVKMK